MKRLLLLLLLFALVGTLQAQIAAFNFSLNAQVETGWTNVAGDPSVAVRSATAGGITVSSISRSNWQSDSYGAAVDDVGTAGVYFTPWVMRNDWYQYNGSSLNLALYNALIPQLSLSGLNKDSTYILRMTGSDVYYSPLITQYTVSGKVTYNSQSLNCYYNDSSGVTFMHVAPDSNGTIRIYVNPNNISYYGMISAIQIFYGSANVGAPAVAITAPANGTIVSEGANVTIAATATEAGGTISKVQFYADTTLIGQATTAPYTFTWTNPDPGNYTINVVATDNTGTVNSASTNIAIESLNYFWSTTGNIATGGDTSFVGTVDSNRLAFRTKNIERMSILPTGNIGIGTITPTAQFHTTGSVRLAGLTSDSTKTRVLVSDTSGNLYYRSASSLTGRWQYANGTVYDSADNIAIGTSNPQGYKLAVNGTAIFTKAKVKSAGTWPDYVFAKDYPLPNLKDLEQYLQTHHHLPEIPAQSEVQREGIDLSEHAAALLKKVEELTLYVIQQDKQLSEQNTRLEAQQKEIDELKELIKDKKN
jgi:hypothetical protein